MRPRPPKTPPRASDPTLAPRRGSGGGVAQGSPGLLGGLWAVITQVANTLIEGIISVTEKPENHVGFKVRRLGSLGFGPYVKLSSLGVSTSSV